ncbi:MAG: hypothetical protein L0Y71_10365 [Gemmataceae bacterium]|nr:hypothetical protein [Gemmataceae bacterium]
MTQWQPLVVPHPQAPEHAPLAGDGVKFAFRPGGPIRVEADLGESGRSLQLAQGLARTLQSQGYDLKPGGWALRVTHEVYDSHTRLLRSPGDRQGVVVPGVKLIYRLIDSDGAVAWEHESKRLFFERKSKYAVKWERQWEGLTSIETTHFNFGGQDIRTAIIEEILERCVAATAWPPGMPRAIAGGGGQVHQLPLRVDYRLD